MSEQLTVACVLRTEGGDYPGAKKTGEDAYDATYVWRLKQQVKRHLSLDHQFVCLTETHIAGVTCRLLAHDWPGWWAKLELFRPDLFTGRVLYLDLDTSVVGPIDGLATYSGRFGMLADWHHHQLGASGVMAWEAGPEVSRRVYEPFTRNPAGAMASHRGDQNWISGSIDWDDLRGLYPGQIVSRWEECADGVPDGARLVCWHGTPRPAEIDWSLDGSREQWREEVGDERHLVG